MKNKFQHSFYLLKDLSGLKVRNCLVFFINWYLIILNSAKKKILKDISYLWNSRLIEPVSINSTEGEAFSGTQWHKC